ncbi:hypothetical protein ACHAPD_006867 [Fusarium lateritium]
MLVFGSFACFVTIIRLTKVITVDLTDPTWGTVDLMIWTGLEVYRTPNNPSAVICCCLPTLRPLIKVAFKKLGLGQLSSSAVTDNERQASGTGGMWSTKPRKTKLHSEDGILGTSDADDMELKKSKYYELGSINGHASSQTSIREHQVV